MQAIDQDDILYRLLTDAWEDCTPFWEAVWEIAFPCEEAEADAHYREAIPEAQRLMRLLLLSGLITVYHGPDYHSGLGAHGEFEVSPKRAAAIIDNPMSWRSPSDTEKVGEYFCFYVTEAGKQLWHMGRKAFRLPENI